MTRRGVDQGGCIDMAVIESGLRKVVLVWMKGVDRGVNQGVGARTFLARPRAAEAADEEEEPAPAAATATAAPSAAAAAAAVLGPG